MLSRCFRYPDVCYSDPHCRWLLDDFSQTSCICCSIQMYKMYKKILNKYCFQIFNFNYSGDPNIEWSKPIQLRNGSDLKNHLNTKQLCSVFSNQLLLSRRVIIVEYRFRVELFTQICYPSSCPFMDDVTQVWSLKCFS